MQKFSKQLKSERDARSWSQGQVAEHIGTTAHNVSRWERNVTYPSPYFRQKLCELFGKSPEELGFVQDNMRRNDNNIPAHTPPTLSEYPSTPLPPQEQSHAWNIPHRRNPFFTGREDILTHLHTALHTGRAVALTQTQAISGLGGIGKTQTATEYAYRYREDYRVVLWARAETRAVLVSDFVEIAELLNLSEKHESDQRRVVEAVKAWLDAHADWLLILDNVEDFSMVSNFIPSFNKGHIVLTTRTQFTGKFAQHIGLEQMEPDEGALFLLRRAKLVAPTGVLAEASPAERAVAEEISRMMDGLPLALDQAGAYIEETACSLMDYLYRYQSRRSKLLELRGGLVEDHPHSVSTTFSLSFKQVEQSYPAAADLLRLCAFLHPDAIPEEIITEGAPDLGPLLSTGANDPLTLDATFAALRMYSLIRRNTSTKTITVHRLVQAVLKDEMNEETQRLWAERAVLAVARTVNSAYSDSKGSRGLVTWERCQRCLPHAHLCAALIDQWGMFRVEAGLLLNQIGAYMDERAQYAQAEMFLNKALVIWRQVLGPEHPNVATSLHDLALLYIDQGKYAQAEPLFQQALAIRETLFGSENEDVATSMNDLGVLYYLQGKYAQAEVLWQRGLDIRERVLAADNVLLAESLNNLTVLYHNQARYTEAEQRLRQALAIAEKTLTLHNTQTAFILDNAARHYRDLGKYAQSEALFMQTLTTREQLLGLEHPQVAQTLTNMARLYYYEGRYTEGEQLCQRALAIWQQTIGLTHPQAAQTLHNLALLYHAQEKYEDAESLYLRTITIREQALGKEHPKTAQTLSNLARLLRDRGDFTRAETLFEQALTSTLQAFPPEHPRIAHLLNEIALLHKAQRRYEETFSLVKKAIAIREKALGAEHPDVAQSLHTLASLYHTQGEYAQAELLYRRAYAIREQVLRPEHPDRARTLEDLRTLLAKEQGYGQISSQ